MLCTLIVLWPHSPHTLPYPHFLLELPSQLHFLKRLTCDLEQSLTLSEGNFRKTGDKLLKGSKLVVRSSEIPHPWLHTSNAAKEEPLLGDFKSIQLPFEPEETWTFLGKLVFLRYCFLGNAVSHIRPGKDTHTVQLQHWQLIAMTLEQATSILLLF